MVSGSDGHLADGVDDERVERADRAVFEPERTVRDMVQAAVVYDDQDAAAVLVRKVAQEPHNLSSVAPNRGWRSVHRRG